MRAFSKANEKPLLFWFGFACGVAATSWLATQRITESQEELTAARTITQGYINTKLALYPHYCQTDNADFTKGAYDDNENTTP